MSRQGRHRLRRPVRRPRPSKKEPPNDLARAVRTLRGNMSAREFGRLFDVSPTAIYHWEANGGVHKYYRVGLLDHARRVGADPHVLAVLEAEQPRQPEDRP